LQVLGVLVEVHRATPEADRNYFSELNCLQHLDNAPAAAAALKELLHGRGQGALTLALF
jgi:hypothetical protein